ncbi:MAG: hypothetical protein A2Y48_04425 [Nitrospirae bacterium RIFCSPLOW2_12_42_9]|nr:MAG: hypothetical protein A2Z60_03810 [Nitrospirae bacterium RIFCSPLOWO2_02_42_7]OGW59005.1 MAG: hypothetical protein A2Y48_04425 [Nitrospirae bacterium RIFCSPLOW2_12_42_9]
MIRLNRIYKELTITLDGLKKGILEIAITTSESTQVAKLLFRIYELEKRLERLYIDTGKLVYELRHLPVNELIENNDIIDYLDKIKILQQDITKVEKEINLLREETIKSKLDELKQYMRRGGFTIDDLVPSKNSEVIGKKIRELRLPPGLIIISLIRHDLLIIPHEDMQIDEGDRIFILGLRDRIKEAASLFITAEQFT